MVITGLNSKDCRTTVARNHLAYQEVDSVTRIGSLVLCLIFFSNAFAQQKIMQYANVKGFSIAYNQTGNGPALLLLHGGLNCDSRAWRPQISDLSANFTVIAWDAPGAGKSDDTPENFTIDDWADCLAGLLDTIGIKQAHILGLSWGGLLAQVFYQRYPARVLSLILCGTYTGWKGSLSDSEFRARTAAALTDASLPPKEIASKYLPSLLGDTPPPQLKEELMNILSGDLHPNGFRAMIKTLAIDTRNLLPEIEVPTLLIWGDSDKRSPLSVAEQFHNSIKGSKLEIISNAGHMTNLENAEQFNKAVEAFCLSIKTKN